MHLRLDICFQERRKLEEKIENLEFKLSDKDRAIEELDEKLRSERTKFEKERGVHTQVIYFLILRTVCRFVGLYVVSFYREFYS
jgi:predicted RNase H-like nuclease (RuvC/YqgF family)